MANETVGLTPNAARRLVRVIKLLESQVRSLVNRSPGRYKVNRRKIYLGKTDASHDQGAAGTISIYSGTTKGSETDTTTNITGVYNRFSDLDSGKWVHVEWLNGGWELSSGEC